MTLIVSLFSLLLAGCAGTNPAYEQTVASDLENKTWILESYGNPDNLQTVLKGTEVTALFDSSEGQVSGSAGANHYFGDYSLRNGEISIQQMAHTEMYRLDPEGVMEQEQNYLSILQSAENYQTNNDTLQINSDGQVLIFTVRKEGDSPETMTSDNPDSEPEPKTVINTASETNKKVVTEPEDERGPVLSDALVTGCRYVEGSENFKRIGLDEGETAVDFTLKDTEGKEITLSSLLQEKPVMMVFGSFT